MTKIYTPTYHELGKSATILARKALIRARLFFSPLYKIIHAQRKIAESPEKSLSLSSLAKSSDCSPSWLSSNFKRLSGISLQSYLRKMKCCHGLWQVLATEKSIKTIALEAGYEPLYFSQLFHKMFGTPPSSLRKLPLY